MSRVLLGVLTCSALSESVSTPKEMRTPEMLSGERDAHKLVGVSTVKSSCTSAVEYVPPVGNGRPESKIYKKGT